MPKVGDVVLYSYLGRTLNAIVVATREGESSHLGKNDESILSVAFIDPQREAGAGSNRIGPFQQRIGYIPTVFVEHDVVHASHEFSDEFKLAQGLDTPAKIAAIRGHGEWSGVVVVPVPPDYAGGAFGFGQSVGDAQSGSIPTLVGEEASDVSTGS